MLLLFISFSHLKDNNSGTKRRTLSQLVEFSLLVKVLLSLPFTLSSDNSVTGRDKNHKKTHNLEMFVVGSGSISQKVKHVIVQTLSPED